MKIGNIGNGYSKTAAFLFILATVVMLQPVKAEARTATTIKEGVYADQISLGGMTVEEAYETIHTYVEGIQDAEITLNLLNENQVVVTAREMGLTWANPELIDYAILLGTEGNVVERYKIMKELQYNHQIYPIKLALNEEAIDSILENRCAKYDQNAIDFSLERSNGAFTVHEGQTGYILDQETSKEYIMNYLLQEWNGEACSLDLEIIVEEPRGSREELAAVGDILGSCITAYPSSTDGRAGNIRRGAGFLNGITLYPGDEFAMLEKVAPFTAANGYFEGGSYVNGMVVDSYGGGICQVSTTLYNAVLLAELEVTERYNHSMTVTYVEPAADAAISNSAGKDFKFINNTEYPIYIESYTTPEKTVGFNIYGVETRPANRKVRYESKVLSETYPDTENIYADANQPVGYVKIQSAHIGYKSELWKIVTEDGVEVSRTKANTSSYKMVPRTATVGVATQDPNAYNEITAAIGTNNIDHVINIAAALAANQLAMEPEVTETDNADW